MSTSIKAKAFQLRELTKDQLVAKLEEFQGALAGLRVEKMTSGAPSKVSQIKIYRKNIARVKTVLTAKQRDALKEHYAGKKYVPLDLRSKKTRAQRRALNKFERTRKTVRQQKRERFTKSLVYAVKA